MIKFDEVSKKYQGSVDALSRVSFELATGEMAFLTGHSGAGKSTLMKLIILLERASQGQVFVNGVNLKRVSAPIYTDGASWGRCGVSEPPVIIRS